MKIVKFVRPVNGIAVEQRRDDGFLNATAMSKAHLAGTGQRRDVLHWLETEAAKRAITHLSLKTGIPVFKLVESRPGRYGGTWIHPRLAVRFAIWLSDEFGYLVEEWVEEWFLSGRNPLHAVDYDIEVQWQLWRQRYDIRVELKDFVRPELMNSVVEWAVEHHENPRTLCAAVHDAMNERIQGAKAKQIRLMGGLPLGVLLRDYFEAVPLVSYSAINRIAKNAVRD
jgi:hypothetical protein